jgi:UDP-glucuronate 4-epimerase
MPPSGAKRVLVTGGAGFIGSHVCEHLLARGDAVIALDNFDDFYDPAIKRRNIADCLAHPGFELVEGDIRDADLLEALPRDGIDAVLHLAARAGVRPSIDSPSLYADVNLVGTTRLLEMVRRHRIRNFVFASSSSVYGERRDAPFRESDAVDQPVSPYAATKKAGELICHAFHRLGELDVACLRFFTVYGPRQRPEMAIHRFTSLIDAGEPVPVYGEGDAQRDFTYVDDIVQGVLAALDRNEGYRIYNLGHHRMVSIDELVAEIGAALGTEPRIRRLPAQPGDVSRTCADISRARELLGYEPRTPLEEGIARFVEWYRGERARAVGGDEVGAVIASPAAG